MTNVVQSGELPDLFVFKNGDRVASVKDWKRRRAELLDLVVNGEYGGMPPTPRQVTYEVLHSNTVDSLGGARFISCRVIIGGKKRKFSFVLYVLVPPGNGPFPVVLTGDGCWRYVTERVVAEVMRRGCVLAQFNRVELAPDIYNSDRTSGIYLTYPDGQYGALSAWAWGYHRCVDALLQMDFVDGNKIAITGHSRGGKTTLLAGATDERIAVTCANNSGCGGAGCYRWQGEGSEQLADTMRMIPYWFAPGLKEWLGREAELPFDQHFLKALVAPRALLTAEALGDLWANPTGTWQTFDAAREAYRFLGAEERIGIWYREGGHDHGFVDWTVFLDFMEWRLHGKACATRFNVSPFPDMPKAFNWSAPMA